MELLYLPHSLNSSNNNCNTVLSVFKNVLRLSVFRTAVEDQYFTLGNDKKELLNSY